MGKTIKNIKIAAFIIVILEIIVLFGFVVSYFYDVLGIKDKILTPYLIIISAGVIILNCVFIWVIVLRISSIRQKIDLDAAEIIGSDVQEAYNFAMLGLAITDDHDVVLWTNDLFKDRHIEIIDEDILKWQPELVKLKKSSNKNEVVKIMVDNRHYEVKYLSDAGLWIFKDNTEYESVFRYNKQQAPVIGILSIDNYEEISYDDNDSNDTATKLKTIIYNYAKEYDILIRKFKEDTFFLLCNFESLNKMKKDNFSLMNKVREININGTTPATLSIGIAHAFPDVIKLNELAQSALNIAMSRGGDQAVISTYGSEMEFIGGKIEAQEKRSRVKIRVLADSLIQLIRNSNNVLIMGHQDMDMDALGACLGIKAICDRLEKVSNIIADFRSTEEKAKSAVHTSFSRDEIEHIFVLPKAIDGLIKPDTLVIVCDAHIPKMTMCPDVLEKINKVVVIDHHRRGEEYIDSPVFDHIEPSASSTCEIVAEFIKYSSLSPHIDLPSKFATIMLSGIFLDTFFFKRKNTGIRTFEACTILKEFGADNQLADDYLKDDFEEVTLINNIVKNLKTQSYGVVYAIGDPTVIYDKTVFAKVADQCLMMKDTHAAFVFGRTAAHEIRMSCRSDGTINVQLLAEKLGGGGHFSSAATIFTKETLEDVEKMLNNILHTSLKEAKNDALIKRNNEGGNY